jgi:UMF1 family MFS transporter
MRHFAELARFLVVFFVYSCGLMTIIAFSTIFASRTLGFTAREIILLFIALQLASAAGAFVFGWLQDRVGARRSIQTALVLWIAVCVASYFCQSKAFFWGIGVVAGLGIGSLQAASRAVVGLFSPLAKSAEFFAFWGLAGKGAYMVGPLVFGALSSATGSQRLAVLLTAAFFVAGLVGMARVDERRGHAAALDWRAPATPAP